MNKRTFLITLLFVFAVSRVIAQDEEMSSDEQTACPETTTPSAEKLVALPVITHQYRSLDTIYTKRDNQSSALQKQQISQKSTLCSSGLELETKSTNSLRSIIQKDKEGRQQQNVTIDF